MSKSTVLQVSTSDKYGGASRAAYRLHSSFLNNKILNFDSYMRVANSKDSHHTVIGSKNKFSKLKSSFKSLLGTSLNKLQKTNNHVLHSCSFLPSRLHNELNRSSFDLVHLHWVQSEFLSIESIGKITKPLVWTLHDSWPFMGSEHYPLNIYDTRFKTGYNLKNRDPIHKGIDLDSWCWHRKISSWKKPIHIITPSQWMAESARSSFLMKDWPINIIPNALPTNVFRPLDKQKSRQIFELPQNKLLILIGSFSGTKDTRKGFDLMLDALQYIVNSIDNFEVVVLGQAEPKIKPMKNIKFHFIPRLHDDVAIATLLSAIDVTVVPSRLDNLPQMTTESLACGTPAVGFNVAGMVDCIDHKTTGYLAKAYNTDELAEGIIWIIKNNTNKVLSENARNKAVSEWSFKKISKMHNEFYLSILEK